MALSIGLTMARFRALDLKPCKALGVTQRSLDFRACLLHVMALQRATPPSAEGAVESQLVGLCEDSLSSKRVGPDGERDARPGGVVDERQCGTYYLRSIKGVAEIRAPAGFTGLRVQFRKVWRGVVVTRCGVCGCVVPRVWHVVFVCCDVQPVCDVA